MRELGDDLAGRLAGGDVFTLEASAEKGKRFLDGIAQLLSAVATAAINAEREKKFKAGGVSM